MNFCCRVVSQVEYPSLVDLRGLLLDLVAQLLGALSRIRYFIIELRLKSFMNDRTIYDHHEGSLKRFAQFVQL